MTNHDAVQVYQGMIEQKQALARLCLEWTIDEFWPAEEFLISLRIPGTFLLFESIGDQWIALALGRAMLEQLELFYIYVSPSGRNQGKADRMLAAFCEHAMRYPQVREIFLEVKPTNTAAQKLYAKHGFIETGRRRRYYKSGEDALVMTKKLAADGGCTCDPDSTP